MKINSNFILKFKYSAILALLSQLLMAQVCRIPMDYITPEQVKKNKVKEMLVHYGNQHENVPYMHFSFGKNNCPYKFVYYDAYSKEHGPFVTEFVVTADSIERLFTKGREKDGNYLPIERTTEIFNKKGNILSRDRIDYGDIQVITHDIFDPSDYKKINYSCLRIHTSSGDTLSLVTNFFDQKTKTYIYRSKKNKVWVEDEKNITTYNNGNIEEEVLYRNGAHHKTYTKKMLEDDKQKANELKGNAIENNNPLPTDDMVYKDTTYTNDENYYPETKLTSDKAGKYMRVTFSYMNDRKKTEYIQLYNRKTGLIYKQVTPVKNRDLYFEYK
jgi:hypothetical protein